MFIVSMKSWAFVTMVVHFEELSHTRKYGWLCFFFLHRQRLRSLTGNNTGIFQVLLVGNWAGAGRRMRLYGPCLGQKQSAKVIVQRSPPTLYHTAVLGPLRLSICCLPVSLTVSRLPTVAKEECYHLFCRIQSIILLFSR